jgi:hypothetical protein
LARDDLETVDLLTDAIQQWAGEGHEEALRHLAIELRRGTERLRWQQRRADLGNGGAQNGQPWRRVKLVRSQPKHTRLWPSLLQRSARQRRLGHLPHRLSCAKDSGSPGNSRSWRCFSSSFTQG